MRTVRIMIGGVLVAMALLFVLRIPRNMRSSNPQDRSHIGADVFLAIICGMGGGALVWERKRDPAKDRPAFSAFPVVAPMQSMPSDNLLVSFDASEALVLFEMLSRRSGEGPSLRIEDAGEKYVLDGLLCQLEKQLVEPFRADYQARVVQARSALRQRAGSA